MRSIWNGAISFGLVSIPIKLVNATEHHSISFRQIHTADGGRIRYRKVCELDGEEIPATEIGKGYEEPGGGIMPITDDDLAALPLPTAKTIEIVAFVPASRIDPLQMDSAYYLSASGAPAAKPYVLLREALKRSDKVAIAKFALRGRERLGMLRVVDDVIAMHGLLWPDEVREPEGVAPEAKVTVRDAELDLADALMDTLGDVELESLHDDYREAVEEMIAAKASGGELPAESAPAAGGGQVIDLMAALEKSVRAAKESRGEEGEEPAAEGVAEVTQMAGKGRGRAAGGSADTGRKPAAKKTAAEKKTAPEKKTTAAKKTASAAREQRSSGQKQSAGQKQSQAAAAKKTTAKKAAPRKRTSA
ncbi:Ku protein [Streptomyces agglomeratus]|uniref:Non-homologous end joining protein Ku n=1 Tax=Streptomyces agglomeratus TaxID=285458 RepID=A0A1E5P645_9ACTN|nr:Ku protein [Streptomyces agglomeratus]OEJ25023.1 Ku protein [Streptomyces agglomeratus]OEJ40952.1 Ku protein [Streptomyces agglomeratus]OEJ44670.1 Ku protein [Streptomyces agglomeratus]OEJ53487.1 Ku protein [Streptomyces agglomeratus]OEJ60827.1 Ku protein [Streptomyces agglomeratus]